MTVAKVRSLWQLSHRKKLHNSPVEIIYHSDMYINMYLFILAI